MPEKTVNLDAALVTPGAAFENGELTVVRVEPYTRKDGQPSQIVHWSLTCIGGCGAIRNHTSGVNSVKYSNRCRACYQADGPAMERLRAAQAAGLKEYRAKLKHDPKARTEHSRKRREGLKRYWDKLRADPTAMRQHIEKMKAGQGKT